MAASIVQSMDLRSISEGFKETLRNSESLRQIHVVSFAYVAIIIVLVRS